MNPFARSSIALRVIVALVGAVTLVLIFVGSVVYQNYASQKLSELESKLDFTAEQFDASVKLAIWNIDKQQIQRLMESAMRDPEVFGIQIDTGENAYVLVRDESWKAASTDARLLVDNDNLLVAERFLDIHGYPLGTLKFYLTRQFLDQSLIETTRLFIIGIALLDVLLIFVLYLLLWLTVLRPLGLIESYAASVSSGRRKEALESTQSLSGEFGQLRNSLDRMIDLLEERVQEISTANDRFWKMVANFPVPLAIYVPETGETLYLNRKFTEVLGYTLEDIPKIEDWFQRAYPDPNYRQEVIDHWSEKLEQAQLANNVVEADVYRVIAKDGQTRMMEIGGVPSGQQLMSILNDITERTRAEEEVKDYQDHLEELVELRTKELVVARDNAEMANRAKSVFLANMSHELRTPLNSVIGFSRMMAKAADLKEQQKKHLEIINRSGTHLLTLINDILEISKIEAGKIELNVAAMHLDNLVNEVVEMLRPRAQQSGISLTAEFDSESLANAVQGDIAKIRQVLLNLVSNAVKFTRKGGVTVKAKARKIGDTLQASFHVLDTGIGISREDQERIFEPFVQVSGASTSTGTGLGLAISRQYLHLMESDLHISSVPGEGSDFSFTLRLPLAETDALVSSESAEKRETKKAQTSPEGIRTLIVDDVAEIRLLLRELLGPLGLQISEAEDGDQAQLLLRESVPELLLLDWRMPGVDGLELTRQVRERTDIQQPTIIMLSAHAFEENRKEALAAGVDDFLSKPIEAEELYRCIEKHLGVDVGAFEDEDLDTDKAKGAIESIDATEISSLPDDVRSAIVDALRELNPGKINEALSRIEAVSPALASKLRGYVDSLQYRTLWQLFDI